MLDSAVADRMYIDAGEVVRVRIEADEFYDDEPGPPKATEGVHQAQTMEGRRAPYTITVSVSSRLMLRHSESWGYINMCYVTSALCLSKDWDR